MIVIKRTILINMNILQPVNDWHMIKLIKIKKYSWEKEQAQTFVVSVEPTGNDISIIHKINILVNGKRKKDMGNEK